MGDRQDNTYVQKPLIPFKIQRVPKQAYFRQKYDSDIKWPTEDKITKRLNTTADILHGVGLGAMAVVPEIVPAYFAASSLNNLQKGNVVNAAADAVFALPLAGAVGKGIKNTTDNIERRAIEVVMRTGAGADGLENSLYGIKALRKTKEGRERLGRIGNYVLTGRRKGIDGTYNSLSTQADPAGGVVVYRGTQSGKAYNSQQKDLIDAFLYGETIDPSFGLRKIAQGKDFGPHTSYIAKNYASKASKIPVYEVNTPFSVPETVVGFPSPWQGRDISGTFTSKEGTMVNVAGHLQRVGMMPNGQMVEQGQDIWKFLGKDYFNKWLNFGNYKKPLTKAIRKAGLHEVNRLGTPVITRTKWAPNYSTYNGWNETKPIDESFSIDESFRVPKLAEILAAKVDLIK